MDTETEHRATKSFHQHAFFGVLRQLHVLRIENSHTAINLGIFALDTRFHDARVAEDDDR